MDYFLNIFDICFLGFDYRFWGYYMGLYFDVCRMEVF